MAYATVDDVIAIWGERQVTVVFDRDGDGTLDLTEAERILTIASQQIDGYLLGRYPLPHPNPPEIAKRTCADIAIYIGANSAEVLSDEMRKRYDDALKYMEMVAANKIKWPWEDDTTTTANLSQKAETQPGRTIVCSSTARLMTPDNTRRVL